MSVLSNAQEFAPIGAEWYYSEHGGGLAPTNSEFVKYLSHKDSIILEKSVRKITRHYFKYNGDTVSLSPYYIHQDKDTIFLYNPDKIQFDRLYIFNASKGDTLVLDVPYDIKYPSISETTYRLIVDSVVSENHDEIILKKYKLSELDDFNWISGWYMDKAGGLDWFTPRGTIIPEAGGPLRCYHDNEIAISFVDYSCDFRVYTGLDNKFNDFFSVYPNPTTGLITIMTDGVDFNSKLYNHFGKLILETNQNSLDISDLPDGIYYLMIQNKASMTTQAIIKKTPANKM